MVPRPVKLVTFIKYTCVLLTAVGAAATAATEGDSCLECHEGWPEFKQWRDSVHAAEAVSCTACHGGDASAFSMDDVRARGGYIGDIPRLAVPGLCAGCHSDPAKMKQYGLPFNQYEEYLTSAHGRAFAAGDAGGAVCTDCHGAHFVLPAADARSSVNRFKLPGTCRRCHADEALMASYGLPADTYEKYAKGVHGRLLLEERVTGVPTCAECHGNHGASPPGVGEVVNVCGSCHVNQRQYYKDSPHAAHAGTREVCVTCHGNHEIARPDDTLYTGAYRGACGSCHEASSRSYKKAKLIAASFAGAKGAIEEARNRFKEARARAIPVEQWEQQLEEAEAKITEAYPVAHSLSYEEVSKLNKAAIKGAHDVETEVDRAFRERGQRKTILTSLLALVSLLIILCVVKWRQLFKQLPN
jgi:hypothetical protein